MKIKLLKGVFFDRKKNMVIFLLTFVILSIILVINTSLVSADLTKQKSLPDFVYTGTVYQSEDGSYPFTNYNHIDGFHDYITSNYDKSIKSYGMICRSIFNYYDELTSIGFSGRVYGVPDEFMNQNLEKYIIEGKLPEEDKKEALIGYYYSKWYGVSVGDTILSTVTLNESWAEEDKNQYVVSGILDERITSYFVGSIIISKNTFEGIYGYNNDNMVMGYFLDNNASENDSDFIELNKVAQDYRALEGTLYSNQKAYYIRTVFVQLILFVLLGSVIMFLIISYFLKGSTAKIGLLKALGISNKNIYRIFGTGFIGLMTFSVFLGYCLSILLIAKMNSYINEFYGFDAHTYRLENISYGLLLIELLIFGASILAYTYFKTIHIQPKKAMMTSE